MIIGSTKEDLSIERRVALLLTQQKILLHLGLKICIEKNYANHIGISDDNLKKLAST